jgi:hypothetical protein
MPRFTRWRRVALSALAFVAAAGCAYSTLYWTWQYLLCRATDRECLANGLLYVRVSSALTLVCFVGFVVLAVTAAFTRRR